jgi:predicted transcriptional regulator
MKTTNAVLHLTVGEPMEASLARASAAMKAAKQGKPAKSYFGVGFDDVGEMFSVFTPKRWELIGALRESGATTVAELARQLKRDYKNVYNDCERLIKWMAIEKDENGLVFAPYSEIVVDMKLPNKRAA